jgi:hypothetical protein
MGDDRAVKFESMASFLKLKLMFWVKEENKLKGLRHW